MSAVEKFPILLSEAEEESSAVPPCFSDEGINVRTKRSISRKGNEGLGKGGEKCHAAPSLSYNLEFELSDLPSKEKDEMQDSEMNARVASGAFQFSLHIIPKDA